MSDNSSDDDDTILYNQLGRSFMDNDLLNNVDGVAEEGPVDLDFLYAGAVIPQPTSSAADTPNPNPNKQEDDIAAALDLAGAGEDLYVPFDDDNHDGGNMAFCAASNSNTMARVLSYDDYVSEGYVTDIEEGVSFPKRSATAKIRRLRGGGPRHSIEESDDDNDEQGTEDEETGAGSHGMEAAGLRKSARVPIVNKRRDEEMARAMNRARAHEQLQAEKRRKRKEKQEEKKAAAEREKEEARRAQTASRMDDATIFESKTGSGVINEGRAVGDHAIPNLLFLEQVRQWNLVNDANKGALIEETLLIQQIDAIIRRDETYGSSTALRVEVDLLSTLLDAGCPLSTFKAVMKWAQRSQARENFSFTQYKCRDRRDIMADLYLRTDMVGTRPAAVPMQLVGTASTFEVVVHDAKQQIYSLLSDSECMKEENLLWEKDPFTPAYSTKGYLNDIVDGAVFKQAQKEFCIVDKRDVVLPILCFLDKSHIDLHGNLALEPFIMTLGIFNRDARNTDKAWRPLGYVPNQSHFKYKSTEEKLTDYHGILNTVLDSLVRLMESEGVAWCVDYKGRRYNVTFKPYTQFIIGDTVGHNSMCNHYQTGGNKKVVRPCRICDVTSENLGNAYSTHKYTKMDDIRKLVNPLNNLAREKLRTISYHNVENAFHKMKFVMGHPDTRQVGRCLHMCVMGETLHVVQQGWFPYFIFGFYDQRKEKRNTTSTAATTVATSKPSEAAKRPKQALVPQAEQHPSGNGNGQTKGGVARNVDTAIVEETPRVEVDLFVFEQEKETQKNKVFPASEIVLFERIAAAVGGRLQHQSDRDLSRTRFAQGITTGKKMAGHEMQGALVIIVMILSSELGRHRYGSNKYLNWERLHAWLGVAEILLCLEEFCKRTRPLHVDDIPRVDASIKAFTERFSKTLENTSDLSLNTQKGHLPVHIPDDIRNHGLVCNWMGAIGETRFVEFKRRARHTQGRPAGFEYQTANRTNEAIAIRRCQAEFTRETTGGIISVAPNSSGHKAMQGKDYVYHHSSRSIVRKKKPFAWKDERLQHRLETFLGALIENKTIGAPGGKLQLFTEYKPSLDKNNSHPSLTERKQIELRGKQVYRSTPCFTQAGGIPRHEWAYVDVDFGTEKKLCVPCHIVMFVNVENVPRDDMRCEGIPIKEAGWYMVCERLKETLVDYHAEVCRANTQSDEKRETNSAQGGAEPAGVQGMKRRRDSQTAESRTTGKMDPSKTVNTPTNESRLVFMGSKVKRGNGGSANDGGGGDKKKKGGPKKRKKTRAPSLQSESPTPAEDPVLYLLPVSWIKAPCIAIPDIPSDDSTNGKKGLYSGGMRNTIEDRCAPYLFLRPRNEWGDLFIKEMDFSGQG